MRKFWAVQSLKKTPLPPPPLSRACLPSSVLSRYTSEVGPVPLPPHPPIAVLLFPSPPLWAPSPPPLRGRWATTAIFVGDLAAVAVAFVVVVGVGLSRPSAPYRRGRLLPARRPLLVVDSPRAHAFGDRLGRRCGCNATATAVGGGHCAVACLTAAVLLPLVLLVGRVLWWRTLRRARLLGWRLPAPEACFRAHGPTPVGPPVCGGGRTGHCFGRRWCRYLPVVPA